MRDVAIEGIDNGFLLKHAEEYEEECPIYDKKGNVVRQESRTRYRYHEEAYLNAADLCARLKKLLVELKAIDK